MEENPYQSPISEGAPSEGREWWRFVACILLAACASPFLLLTIFACVAAGGALYQTDWSSCVLFAFVLLVSGAVTAGLLLLARRCIP